MVLFLIFIIGPICVLAGVFLFLNFIDQKDKYIYKELSEEWNSMSEEEQIASGRENILC